MRHKRFWVTLGAILYCTVILTVLTFTSAYNKNAFNWNNLENIISTTTGEAGQVNSDRLIHSQSQKETVKPTMVTSRPNTTRIISTSTSLSSIITLSSTIISQTPQFPLPTISMPSNAKYAYIFYATNRDYFCHALVNADLMINQYNVSRNIDIVILVLKHLESIIDKDYCVKECYGDQVKIIGVESPPGLTNNAYYKHCYVKLLTFSLYDKYSRIVFLDSDGLVLQNMDHIFNVDLSPYKVGAAHAYWIGKWLTTVFFVADLSAELNEKVSQYLDSKNLDKIHKWAKRVAFDMEVMNYVFDEGRKLKLLPFNYARLDDFFKDPAHAQHWNNTYYVHFSHRKPFYYRQSKLWHENPSKSPSKTPAFIRLFQIFWAGADKHDDIDQHDYDLVFKRLRHLAAEASNSQFSRINLKTNLGSLKPIERRLFANYVAQEFGINISPQDVTDYFSYTVKGVVNYVVEKLRE